MLPNHSRFIFLVLFSLLVSGCMDFDFGSGETEVKGCSARSPMSVTEGLESRYALGSSTSLSVSGLVNPTVSSSDPHVVQVGPIETVPAGGDDESPDRRVELVFVGEGEAFITVTEPDSPTASVPVDVAAFERFEVILPTDSYPDPVVPLAGKTVVEPELEVVYFDGDGRLHGRGLAQTTWEPTGSLIDDVFFNDSLEPGPNEVTVRAGGRASLIHFEAVEPGEVIALGILETERDDDIVRLDLVGLTDSDEPVWNIQPVFFHEGLLYNGAFEYRHDPDASPQDLSAHSWNFSLYGDLEGIETTFQGEPTLEGHPLFDFGAIGGGGPIAALLSLLMMVLGVRGVTTRNRFKAEADTPS